MAAAHRRPDVFGSCGCWVSPGLSMQLAVFERSGPILAGVGVMATETGSSEALPLWGIREMATATLCVSD